MSARYQAPAAREGFEYRRIQVPRASLGSFRPEFGWQIKAYGRSVETASGDITVTISRPLPPAPTRHTIIDLAMELLRPHGRCTVSWMATELGLSEARLLSLLVQAGLPKAGSQRPWMRKEDRILWMNGTKEVGSKRLENEEPVPDGVDWPESD